MYDSFFSAFSPRATIFRTTSAALATAPGFSSSVLDQLSGTVSSDIHSIIDLKTFTKNGCLKPSCPVNTGFLLHPSVKEVDYR